MKIEFSETTVKITRNSSKRLYSDSALLHAVKVELQKQGFDVIKKLMWKDGHMVDDHQHYVRSRKVSKTEQSFWIYQMDYAVRNAYPSYNDGSVVLGVGYNTFDSRRGGQYRMIAL